MQFGPLYPVLLGGDLAIDAKVEYGREPERNLSLLGFQFVALLRVLFPSGPGVGLDSFYETGPGGGIVHSQSAEELVEEEGNQLREFFEFSIADGTFPDELFSALRVLASEAGPVIEMKDEIEHPKMQEALRLLSSYGLNPRTPPWGEVMPGQFRSWLRRVYDDADLESCEYVEVSPISGQHTGYYEYHDNHFVANSKGLKASNDLMRLSDAYICPPRVRAILDSAFLRGLRWHPVLLGTFRSDSLKKVIDWPSSDERWWQLGSDVTLPPVSPSLVKTKSSGVVCDRSDKGGYIVIYEPPYYDSTLRYLESEFRAVGPFDVSATYEICAAPTAVRVVVSKRFYQFWRNAGLKAQWRPVVLEQ